MPQQNQKTVTVSGKSLEKLEAKYKSEKAKNPNLKFATFISESALMELERRNILKDSTFIAFVAFNDDSVILKDSRKGKLFEVQVRNKKLKCLEDDDFDCIHVGFALALPEIRRKLNG